MEGRSPSMNEILAPFLLSLIAGAASGLGGLVVYFFGDVKDWLMGFLMGFAGGVMLVVAFLELFTEALGKLWREMPKAMKPRTSRRRSSNNIPSPHTKKRIR